MSLEPIPQVNKMTTNLQFYVTLAQFWGPKNSFSPGGMRELPLALPFPELPEDPEGVKE